MSFLSPFLLLLAAAAAVPLLLHLLPRRLETRIDFPAARYLARAERERSREMRLKNLLLMLLRVAAVVLVALAAARPVGRFGGGGHAPTALAIVLDNSLSSSAVVDGQPVLETLKRAASAALAKATAAERVWLVTADAEVVGGSTAAIEEAIGRTEPLASAGRLPEAVAAAAALLAGVEIPEHRIAILTDGQATSWPALVDLGAGPPAAVIFRPTLVLPVNRAIGRAEARPAHWTPRGEVAFTVSAPDSTGYRIGLGDLTLARGTAPAGEEIVVRATPSEQGWTAGAVELPPDEMRGDNTRFFAVWIGAAPRVRADTSAGSFVRSAAEVLMQQGRLAAGDGVTITSAEQLTMLPALIAAPADPVRIGAANRALERAGVPWRFTPMQRGSAPIRGLGDDGAVALQRYGLAPRGVAPADTLATANGDPWVVAGEGYVLVASALDPAATSLPIRASFVPWLAAALSERLTGGAGAALRAAPGAFLARPEWADALESSDGARTPLDGPRFQVPRRPGVAFLLAAGVRRQAVVVNPEPEESDLAQLDARALGDRIHAATVRVDEDLDAWANAVFSGAARRSLGTPLLVLALGALVFESVLAGAGRKRPSG